MYGTRRATRLWADYVRRALEDDGSEAVFSMFFVNRSKRYIVAVWSDDFAFIVVSEMLPHLTELLERNFECKLIGNIGPGMHKNVVKLSGFEWHADTKHSRPDLLKHGLEEGKSTSAVSPGSKISGTNIRDSEDYLSVQEMKEYASVAGTLLYHALDRPGSIDVGGYEAAAQTLGYDETLFEIYARTMLLCMGVRLPRMARRAGDTDGCGLGLRQRTQEICGLCAYLPWWQQVVSISTARPEVRKMDISMRDVLRVTEC